MSASHSTKVALGLATMYVAWGTTYIAIAYTIQTMPSEYSMASRFLFAALLLGTWIGVRSGWREFIIGKRQFLSVATLGTLLLAMGLGNLSIAEKVVPIGVSSLIVAAMPLWTALFRALTHDRPSSKSVVGLVAGFIGIGLILLPGHTMARPHSEGMNVNFWMFMILIGNISWAIGSFITPKLDTPKNPLVLSTYEMLIASVVLAISGSIRHESVHVMLSASTASKLGWLYLVIVGSLIGYTTFTWLLGNAPISLVSTYAYVNPVVAVGLSMLLFNEHLTTTMAIGGTLVVVSVAIVVRSEGAKPQSSPEV